MDTFKPIYFRLLCGENASVDTLFQHSTYPKHGKFMTGLRSSWARERLALEEEFRWELLLLLGMCLPLVCGGICCVGVDGVVVGA